MNQRIQSRLGGAIAAGLLICLLSACNLSSAGAGPTSTASAPTATATVALPTASPTYTLPGAPSGWQVYHNFGFAVAYPSDQMPAESIRHQSVTFYNSRLSIIQAGADVTNAQTCSLASGESWVTLAGLTWRYSIVGGNVRDFFFAGTGGNGIEIQATDAQYASTSLEVQQDNAILATLKLDDPAPGCANWGA